MAGLVPQITLFTPDYRRVAPINFFESLKLSLKWNGLSTLELVVSGDHSRLDGLTKPGARLVVDYGDRSWVLADAEETAQAVPARVFRRAAKIAQSGESADFAQVEVMFTNIRLQTRHLRIQRHICGSNLTRHTLFTP